METLGVDPFRSVVVFKIFQHHRRLLWAGGSIFSSSLVWRCAFICLRALCPADSFPHSGFWRYPYKFWSLAVPAHIRLNSSGKLIFNPRATFSMFTTDTLRTPRSMPL
jgi:hypothetical protein